MKEICRDLAAEQEDLDFLVGNLDEDQWSLSVPFDDWTIKDEISHLAYFDRAAFLAATDRNAFDREVESIMKDFTDFDQIFRQTNARGNAMPPESLLAWWRKERQRLVSAYAGMSPDTRLPWYGPSMSARSAATARLMETWAHGQDIVDKLGVKREATSRLKHIAHIGVKTFAWAFQNRGLPVPEARVRVELKAPSGEKWDWGPDSAFDKVSGSALDFCLVATQRRHPLDTGLEIRGETAEKWMSVIQAFAGPPEDGPDMGERCGNK